MEGAIRGVVLVVAATCVRIEFLPSKILQPRANMPPQLFCGLGITCGKLVNPAGDGFLLQRCYSGDVA